MTRFAILMAVALALGAPAAHAAWKPLVTPAEAAALIGADAVVIDIRAPEAFAAGHVAGAVNLPYPAWRGPAENPGALVEGEAVQALLRKAGATPASTVIVLNEGRDSLDFGAAARVYWTVKSAGISNVTILNGGLTAWQGAGLALSTIAREPAPSAAEFALSGAWT
ncbi:MAG: rhodanese-like domain-containing protein, partial [Thermohalobaculum sp.]|nr:rhodanese-like domain-containing protein [Thermohalobaculum sp.]